MKKASTKARSFRQYIARSFKGSEPESSEGVARQCPEERGVLGSKERQQMEYSNSQPDCEPVNVGSSIDMSATESAHQFVVDGCHKSLGSLTPVLSCQEDVSDQKNKANPPTTVTNSVSKMMEALSKFKTHYEQFAVKNGRFILLGNDLHSVFNEAEVHSDTKVAAQTLEYSISKVLQTIEKRNDFGKTKWTRRLGNFLRKVYPVARLSLSLIERVAELLDNELEREDEFLFYLRRIEFESVILADNPNYDLHLEMTQDILKNKSVDLITAMITFFDSALLYFSRDFFVNVGRSVIYGLDMYEEGKKQVDIAIREYDQAVMHVTARIVIEMKYQKDQSKRNKQDENFRQWLAPSSWSVEDQLHRVREKRNKDTLHWARDMIEFRNWRLADLHQAPVLWIKGPLGFGKSTMAGYFIDLLKCMYPKSIVAYFFCRTKQAGLYTARDIICALAYQCAKDNSAARSALEALKSQDFRVFESLGVDFLFEKVLLEPLQHTQNDVYIVIDGLDEADAEASDDSECSGLSDLHVLLKRLTRLPSTRLLITSRPVAGISNIIPDVIIKTIDPKDNAEDINTFVRKFIDESKALQTLFKAEKLDPVKYFEEKAEGVFLWVVLVIQQLAKAKAESVFKKYLNGFSSASGSMHKLYNTILSRIEREDRKWVKEIIRWLVVAERRLSVAELKDAVEWCLEDKLVDFNDFLEVDCGSILQLTQRDSFYYRPSVQIVHETFRSFVLDPEICPQDFLIDEAKAHAYVAMKCLEHLSNTSDYQTINRYCATKWVHHLLKTIPFRQSKELLISLQRFFNSEGVKRWIMGGSIQEAIVLEDGLQIHSEIKDLDAIGQWLQNYECECHDTQDVTSGSPTDRLDELFNQALKWRQAILSDTTLLGELMGKAAADIWLHEALPDTQSVVNSFLLALKYYWKRKNRKQSNLAELDELIASEFEDISVWAGSGKNVVKRNMGVAYFSLYRWDECIRCLKDEAFVDDDIQFRMYLSSALKASGDYEGAIEIAQTGFDQFAKYSSYTLLEAYLEKDDADGAIAIFRTAIEKCSFDVPLWKALLWACDATGVYDVAINTFSNALANATDSQTFEKALGWIYLGAAYRSNGDLDNAIKALKMSIQIDSKDRFDWYWTSLWQAYETKGDHIEAIKMFRQLADERPTNENSWKFLCSAYMANEDYDRAICVLEMAIIKCKLNFAWWGDCVLQAYMKKGTLDEAIQVLKIAIHEHPSEWNLWKSLGDAYLAKGDYDLAIKVLEEATDQDCYSRMYLNLFQAYKAKGDYDGAIKLFETIIHKVEPFDYEWLSELLEAYRNRDDYDGAIKAFEALIKSPKHLEEWTWAWSGLFKAYIGKGDYHGVITRLENAIEQSGLPSPPWMEYDLLDAYIAMRDYDGAINRLKDVVASRPMGSWAWKALGNAFKSRGDYDKALETYQSGLKQISIASSFHICKGDVYLEKLDYEAAINAYQCAIDSCKAIFKGVSGSVLIAYLVVRPSFISQPYRITVPIDESLVSSFLWNSLAEAHKGRGDHDAAIRVYDEAIRGYHAALRDSSNHLLWHQIQRANSASLAEFNFTGQLPSKILWTVVGHIYKLKGDWSEALKAFKKALKMDPDNSFLLEWSHSLEHSIHDVDRDAS